MFAKRKTADLLEKVEKNEFASSYRQQLWSRFRQNKWALWPFRCLQLLIVIALFSDFIANEKPLYCKIEGQHYFPVFKTYAVDLGLSKWDTQFLMTEWSEHDYEKVWMPLIPYSSTTLNLKNKYKSPFDTQKVPSLRYRHWLGTDQLGRDVAAAMINGTRIALLVGLIAMSIAAIIGIFLGSLAGYFGDSGYKSSRSRIIMVLLGIIPAIFYAFVVRKFNFLQSDASFLLELLKSIFIFGMIMLLFLGIGRLLEKIPIMKKQVAIPFDLLIMRLIEIFNSIPGLLLLLAFIGIIQSPSILNIMVIIGLLSWTGIARFIRAELLKIRNLEYIESVKSMGFSTFRILWYHAIPNALPPVLIVIVFGIAGAILLEASLSFLGIGVSPDKTISWGTLLLFARGYFSAWWLAIFPGLAIFLTVTIFNLIGEGLTDAIDH